MKNYSVVVRSWQKGAGHPGVTLNREIFRERLASPIELMLRTSNSDLARIVVVVNVDNRYPNFLGEGIGEDGFSPTMRALREAFDDRIDILGEPDWGNNAGSATALNTGWRFAVRNPEIGQILSWNPEMALTGFHVGHMRHFMYEHCLEACGYLRERWYWLPQFSLLQNTAALYKATALKEVDGFSERCNGNDGATIKTEKLGNVTLAGMDDQEFLMRLIKNRQNDIPRIGMVGRSNPAPWKTHFPDDPERQRMFDIKVARQYAVIRHWVGAHFPEITVEDYLEKVFRQMFIGS